MNNRNSWQPNASIETLRQRAYLLAQIRQFFNTRGYLEVETPVMGHYGVTDVYLSNITAWCQKKNAYLQTSPEYHMKRLLAAGSGPIFQIARVFRDDELGRWHNPEFSLLEWYQLGCDHHQLMQEVDLFLQIILQCPPLIRKTYQEAFQTMCDFDPFDSSLQSLQNILLRYDLDHVPISNFDEGLFLLMSHVIEPALAQYAEPVAIYDFPVSQAALAQIHNNRAARFEIYYQGVELANGFHELCDSQLQQQRFNEDLAKRKLQDLLELTVDPRFLAALAAGLPACSGVALGLDRLFALALKKETIADVLAFAWNNA